MNFLWYYFEQIIVTKKVKKKMQHQTKKIWVKTPEQKIVLKKTDKKKTNDRMKWKKYSYKTRCQNKLRHNKNRTELCFVFKKKFNLHILCVF